MLSRLYVRLRLAFMAAFASKLEAGLVILVLALGMSLGESLFALYHALRANILKSGYDACAGAVGGSFLAHKGISIQDLAALKEQTKAPVLFCGDASTSCSVTVNGQHFPGFLTGRSVPRPPFMPSAAEGRDLTESDRDNVCFLPWRARKILFGTNSVVGQKIRIDDTEFTVVGAEAIPAGRDELDLALGKVVCPIVPLVKVQKRLRDQNILSAIYFRTPNPKSFDSTVAEITAILRKEHRLGEEGDDDFMITTGEAFRQAYQDMTRTYRLFGWVLCAVAMGLGCGMLSHVMLLAVNRKRTEIGLKRALGARKSSIIQEFLLEASFLVAGGLFLGVVSAWFVAIPIFKKLFSHAQGSQNYQLTVDYKLMAMDTHSILGLCLLALVIAGISIVLPARRIAGMRPVDALR